MITLIHGDNIEESRKAFVELKKKFKPQDLREIDGKSIDLTTLAQALHSDSLFGKDRVVVIENALTFVAKKPKHLELLLTGEHSILWEGKEVPASILKYFAKADIKLFKIPKRIFQFLDSLSPSKTTPLLDLYTNLEETNIPEVIFSMISKRFRQLIMVADGVTLEGMQGWQMSKLRMQAKFFDKRSLQDLYAKLLDIDASIKTGESPFSLSSHIRQFLVSL